MFNPLEKTLSEIDLECKKYSVSELWKTMSYLRGVEDSLCNELCIKSSVCTHCGEKCKLNKEGLCIECENFLCQ